MKKLFILFVVISAVSMAQWRIPYNIPIAGISSGQVIDENNIWLSGGYQALYKSTDGGLTWEKKYNIDTTTYTAYDVCFVNSAIGYSGGSYGSILKTTDGGENWERLKIPDTTYSIGAIHFFDANTGFVMSTKNKTTKIFKTIDGAASWNLADSIGAALLTMEFWSPTVGIATGTASDLYYTSDGTTWTKATNPTFPPITYSRSDQWGLKFVSATTAYSCGWGSTSVGYEPTIFLKTTDAGVTWTVLEQKTENCVYVNFKSLYFKDELNGISVGGSTYPGTVLCKTSDGGLNWIPLSSFSGFSPTTVIGFNNTVIVAGGGGNILRSTDFGDSWTMINDHPGETISSIGIYNNNLMYGTGTSGIFWKSTDKGSTFRTNYMPVGDVCLWSQDIQMINENLGYACSQKGQVIKTTNGGSNWFQVHPDTVSNSVTNSGLCFLNENLGFVVGKYGNNTDIIYKTTDGGITWSSVSNKAFQDLYSVSFANENQGAACGNKSAMLYTTNQGETWQQASLPIMDQTAINDIKFYDGLNGIAVGVGIVLKTADGGASWTKSSDASFTFSAKSVFVKDANTFYAAGGKYVIMSTDAGNSWTNIADTIFTKSKGFTSINSVVLDNDGFVWIGGGSGFATNAPVSAINDHEMTINSFSLEQNYPNPFNPSTKIHFNLKESGSVSLKLYDVLGRVVKEIFNGEMPAGNHVILYNGSGLASGTYIYTLKVNNQFMSRKMTLLK